jgi:hypothetical protein
MSTDKVTAASLFSLFTAAGINASRGAAFLLTGEMKVCNSDKNDPINLLL